MAWKIYFFFLSSLLVLSYWAGWGDRWIVYDYLDVPMQIILFSGLYGYAFKQRIGSAGFWRIWLPFIIFWDLAGLLIHYEPSQDNESAVLMGVLIYIVYMPIIPAYLAIYFYGHKSEELWNPQTNSP